MQHRETPVMREYNALVASNADKFVIMKLGLFYHMYNEDAHYACNLLNSSEERVTDDQLRVDERSPNHTIAWPATMHEEASFILSLERPLIIFEPKLRGRRIEFERERLGGARPQRGPRTSPIVS